MFYIHLVHWNCTSKYQGKYIFGVLVGRKGFFTLSSKHVLAGFLPEARINDLKHSINQREIGVGLLHDFLTPFVRKFHVVPMYNPRIPTLQSRVCLFLSLAFAGQHHYNLIVKHGPWFWLITHKSTCKSLHCNRMLTNHSQHPSCCAWQT